MDSKSSPLKNLLSKPFSSPPYNAFPSKVRPPTVSHQTARRAAHLHAPINRSFSSMLATGEQDTEPIATASRSHAPPIAPAECCGLNDTVAATAGHGAPIADACHRARRRSRFDQNPELRGHRESGLRLEPAENQLPYTQLRIQSVSIPWCHHANPRAKMHGRNRGFANWPHSFRVRFSVMGAYSINDIGFGLLAVLCGPLQALIFRSGKVVCTGARNENDANLGTRKFARILQKLGYPVGIAVAMFGYTMPTCLQYIAFHLYHIPCRSNSSSSKYRIWWQRWTCGSRSGWSI